MKNDQQSLIHDLVNDLKPVAPVSGRRQLGVWLVSVVIALILGVALYNLRYNLLAQLSNPAYLLETVALILAMSIGGWYAIRSSVPASKTHYVVRGAIAGGLAWLGLLSYRLIAESLASGLSFPGASLICVTIVSTISVLPLVGALLVTRKAYPLYPLKTCLAVALSSSLVGMVGIQFICPMEGAMHILVWHGGPMLAITFLATFLAYGVLQSRSKSSLRSK